MDIRACFAAGGPLLMEGALGERLKREHGLAFDDQVAMAGLVYSEAGRGALGSLWGQYAAIARRHGLPFLATTPTRRANRDRVAASSFDAAVIRDNLRFLRETLAAFSSTDGTMFAGGLMGCRGDAYTGEGALAEEDARTFHAWQAERFAEAGTDFLYAAIMPTLPEAMGMARALAATGLPYIISFTIRPDGRIVDGATIHDAVVAVDNAVPDHPPLCYMTNCVHPCLAHKALSRPCNRTAAVRERFRGIQANTSPLTYAELDGAADPHCSRPEDFANDMARLKSDMGLTIMGGCCGTDHRHMEAVARVLAGTLFRPAAGTEERSGKIGSGTR